MIGIIPITGTIGIFLIPMIGICHHENIPFKKIIIKLNHKSIIFYN